MNAYATEERSESAWRDEVDSSGASAWVEAYLLSVELAVGKLK